MLTAENTRAIIMPRARKPPPKCVEVRILHGTHANGEKRKIGEVIMVSRADASLLCGSAVAERIKAATGPEPAPAPKKKVGRPKKGGV